MQTQNQNITSQQGMNSQHLRFVPVASNVSYLGTTVTYGIGGTSDINAFGNQNYNSGNFGNQNYLSGNYGMTQQGGWNAGYSGFSPSISAGQFGQIGSGVFDFNNQYRRGLLVQPSVDISETSSDIVVSAFVTTNAINNMNLNVTQDSLTISGYFWTGSEQLVLHRTIPLSTSVRAEAVEASLQSGVLEIRLPKTEKINRNKPTVGQDVIQA